MAANPHYEVLVIGAGLAGLWVGIALKEAGITNFAILEKAAEVGGTWKVNRYPGVAVDVNSFSYSYSKSKVPYFEWSRAFAPGKEVAAYAEHLADTFDLRSHIRFHTEVKSAHFDERAHVWRLHLADGTDATSRFLIHAPGGLTQPKRPEIEGLRDFAGPMMHTAEWDDRVDLRGKRVAVIGTGASAVQVVPAIASQVKHLSVFQRTPIWVAPKLDFEISPRMRQVYERVPGAFDATRLMTSLPSTVFFRIGTIHARRFPFLQRGAERYMKRHLARQVRDPIVREKLTPKYGFGCKRPVISNDYLATFNRENVSLITDRIERVEKGGMVTKSRGRGESEQLSPHKLDVLILATGFKVFELGNAPPYPVYGKQGEELGQFWHQHRYQAYEASTVPQYPNMFLITAPYGLGGASYLAMVEAATQHALRVIREARSRGATYAAVRQDAHDRYFQHILQRQAYSVFQNGTCAGSNSYYFDRHGDAPAMRPHLGFEIKWRSRFSNLDHYEYRHAPSVTESVPPITTTNNNKRRTMSERIVAAASS